MWCSVTGHLAVAGVVFDGVFLCCPFSHEMSWMRSGTYLSQFLRVYLPTRGLTGGFLLLRIFRYFCESSCLFYLRFNFDFYVSKIMHL